MKIAALVFLAIASPAWAQQAQSPLIQNPSPVVTPVTPTPTATMNQIITRLNTQQYQINAAAAQSAAQRPIFVPQRIIVKPAK